MVDMNSDQIFEVPDTPDRMQQSTCPASIPGARRGVVAGITRNNCFQWDNMVDMNSDQTFEVPDTPDQIQQSARPSPGARRAIRNVAGNPLPSPRFKFKTRDDSIQGQSSRDNSSSVLPTPSDAENIFRQAELARLLPAAGLEEKPSSRDSHRTTEASFKYEKGPGKLGINQESSISNHLSYRDTEERSLGYRIRGDISQQGSSCQNVDILGVGSGFPTISMGNPHNIRGSSASNKPKEIVGADICSGSSPRKDKWKTIPNKNTTGLSSPTPCIVPQRHAGQRKLVRNGCISPSNIVSKSVKVHENREMCSTSRALHNTNPHVDISEKGYVIDLTDISPTITMRGNTVNDGLTSVNSMETRAARKFRTARSWETAIPQSTNQNCCEGSKKGKEIVHNFIGAKQTGESNMRVCPRSAADSSSIANNDCTGVSSEQGWRTTHNHTSKFPVSLLSRTTSSHGRESGSSGPSNEGNEIVEGDNNNSIGGATTMRTTSFGNRIIRVGRGKRKQTSSSCHPGECSSSLDEPRGPCLLSSNTTAGRNLTSNCSDIPVINIDDICSHEVRPSSSSSGYRNGTSVDPNIRAQMESDELLARQIQEQLYNETPSVVPTEQIDAIVAMSLQHEEDTQRTSRTVRRFQNNTRGARASRSSASQRAFRVGYEAANSMISQVQNASPITFRTRAAYARYPAPHLRANIDLNDYDALLALDENNHQHAGASESQINNLPQSVIQSNSIEPCAVCLENPCMGDTIRHLPCFHKFHKDCIDEWLRRKKLCPICKSGIT